MRLQSYGVALGLDDPWFRAVSSHRLLDIANAYLEMWSKLEYVDVWYSVPQPAAAERISSQRWHRDYNDKHLLKVFLYLVDVDEDMGPFQYVAGSQPGGPYADAWELAAARPELPDRGRARGARSGGGGADVHGAGGHARLLQHGRLPPRRLLDDEPARARDGHVLLARLARVADRAELHVHGRARRARRTSRGSRSPERARSNGVHARSAVHSRSGRTTPRHWPVKVPRDESPSAGSCTWNDTASCTDTWWWSFGESIEHTAASTQTRPSFRKLPGIHAVATYSPGGEGSCQRGSTSIALNAIWPAVVTLIFGHHWRSTALEHREPELDADRPPHVDVIDRPAFGVDDPHGAQAHEVVSGSLVRRPRPAGAGSRRGLQVVRDDFLAPPVANDAPVFEKQRAVTELSDCLHVVRHEEHRPSGVSEILHPPQAARLELSVANGKNLVDEQDLGLEVGRDGEGEPNVHPARVALHRRVEELGDPGEVDDLG